MIFIIAEAGVNHGGNIDTAKRLINAAKASGANAVKFQAFTPERLDPPGARRDMLERLKLSKKQLIELSDYAKWRGIEFMVTPFDAEWCRWCFQNLSLRRVKIASGCLWDTELLEAARDTGLPVILSTGLTDSAEFLKAISIIRHDYTVMHCVSRYPTVPEELNLLRVGNFADDGGYSVGFSDHSTSILPPALAVALGATVIEKHLTLSRSHEGPDHMSSLEPVEFAEMVYLARQAEKMLGSSVMWPPHPEFAGSVKKERMAWRRTS